MTGCFAAIDAPGRGFGQVLYRLRFPSHRMRDRVDHPDHLADRRRRRIPADLRAALLRPGTLDLFPAAERLHSCGSDMRSASRSRRRERHLKAGGSKARTRPRRRSFSTSAATPKTCFTPRARRRTSTRAQWWSSTIAGYGGSSGEPGQQALYEGGLAIYDYAIKRGVPAEHIVVMGRSLGSGVASMLAGARPVGAAILITPYDSLAAVAAGHYPLLPVRLLLRHPFPSTDWAQRTHAPALFLAADTMTSFRATHAQKLFEVWAGPKQIHVLRGRATTTSRPTRTTTASSTSFFRSRGANAAVCRTESSNCFGSVKDAVVPRLLVVHRFDTSCPRRARASKLRAFCGVWKGEPPSADVSPAPCRIRIGTCRRAMRVDLILGVAGGFEHRRRDAAGAECVVEGRAAAQ